jgi:hypothetical protein
VGFTLHLHTCNLGTAVRTCRNPFTKELVTVPIDHGLTKSERQAVTELLEEVGAGEPDPDTYCRVELPDGTYVNVAVGTLADVDVARVAFAVECSALSLEVVAFVYALASWGNLSIGSSIDPEVVALPHRRQWDRVSKRWPKASVVESPSELKVWLKQNLLAGRIVRSRKCRTSDCS